MTNNERLRCLAAGDINNNPRSRQELEATEGTVWVYRELTADFDVLSFLAPLVWVVRKSDGVRGTMFYQDRPRFYWGFEEDEPGA